MAEGRLLAAAAADPSLALTPTLRLLALTAKAVAVDQVNQAAALATPQQQSRVAAAGALLAQGQPLLAGGDSLGAIAAFQDALRQVQGIAH